MSSRYRTAECLYCDHETQQKNVQSTPPAAAPDADLSPVWQCLDCYRLQDPSTELSIQRKPLTQMIFDPYDTDRD